MGEEEEEDGVGTGGGNDDWVNVVACDGVDGRSAGWTGKTAGGWMMLGGDLGSDGTADDN